MGADVGDEVVDHLAKAPWVPTDRDDIVHLQRDVAIRGHGVRRVHRLRGQLAQIHGDAIEGSALVELREQEEIVDETSHA